MIERCLLPVARRATEKGEGLRWRIWVSGQGKNTMYYYSSLLKASVNNNILLGGEKGKVRLFLEPLFPMEWANTSGGGQRREFSRGQSLPKWKSYYTTTTTT